MRVANPRFSKGTTEATKGASASAAAAWSPAKRSDSASSMV